MGCNIACCSAKPPPPANWDKLCLKARKISKGTYAIFLGRNENNQSRSSHPYMILTDYDVPSSSLDDDRLQLPKVPAAILEAQSKTRQQDFYDQAEARGLGQKFDLCHQNTPEDFEKLLTVDDTVWRSMFLEDDELDATVRQKILRFIDQLLKFYQWSSKIPVPSSTLQNDDDLSWIVGKKIVLGGGLEMVYLSPPGICFADSNDSEKAWFGVRHYHIKPPVVRLPVVVYQSAEEGWYSMRINVIEVITALPKSNSGLDNNNVDIICLKIFIAGAEIGDLALLFSEQYDNATRAALANKQEKLFAAAAEKLIALLHPHRKREQAFYLLKLGEMYDSLASRFLKEDAQQNAASAREAILKAALTYKSAVDLTREFYPNIGLRIRAYEALAMSLVRLGEFEMAVRAIVWAFTDPTSRKPCRQAVSLRQNMVQLWQHMHNMSTDDRTNSTKESLKAQRDHVKKDARRGGLFLINCRKCLKLYAETSDEISRCQRCLDPYCSRSCQKADWQEHRIKCIPAVKNTVPSSEFEKCAHCPDATRALLADGRINKNDFSMPLSVWSGYVDQHSARAADQYVNHPDTPDSLTALILKHREG